MSYQTTVGMEVWAAAHVAVWCRSRCLSFDRVVLGIMKKGQLLLLLLFTTHLRGSIYSVIAFDVSATKMDLSDVVIQLILTWCGMAKSILDVPKESSLVMFVRVFIGLFVDESKANISVKRSIGFGVVDNSTTLEPISQQTTEPSLPPESTNRSLLLANVGNCIDATEESWPSKRYAVWTRLRLSIEKMGMVPSPRPAAKSFPVGLQANE